MTARLQTRGLLIFLILSFAGSIGAAVALQSMGLSTSAGNPLAANLTLAAVMFAPAVGAIAARLLTRDSWADAGLRFGSWRRYALVWLAILLLFVLIYGITWFIGFSPDFTLQRFIQKYPMQLPMPAGRFISIIFLATVTVTPFINSVAAFGEELGWRGYLLPKLLPLGTRTALILHGIIWGLWHAPLVLLIGFGGYAHPVLGAALFTLVITCIGVWFGYLRLTSGSTFLVSFAHGMLNSQGYGAWAFLFAGADPFIAGVGGVIGLVVFGCVATWVLWKVPRDTPVIMQASSPA